MTALNKLAIIVVIVTLLSSCDSPTKKPDHMVEGKAQTEDSASPADSTPRVTGIGGVFFYSDNPEETKAWYVKNLGLEINDWGSSSFESRDLDNPDKINSLQWKPFKDGDEYFSPSTKSFMLNYQVQNIEGLLSNLKANGVTILDSLTTYAGIGKFVHIMDADGNKIELWEPEN